MIHKDTFISRTNIFKFVNNCYTARYISIKQYPMCMLDINIIEE